MKIIKIALVAGEPSGDKIGAGLIRELKKNLNDQVEVIGIGGPKMIQEGLNSLVDMQRLSIMGIKDALKHYYSLRKIRNMLVKHLQDNPPDVFIGIDYSYFNLSLEYRLKKIGIKTVHLVSPKVWAWRQKRVNYIKKSVDLMLTLFPFEVPFYKAHDVPAKFIGHPFADNIDMEIDREPIRQKLGFSPQDTVISVLPGSRASEVHYLGPLFIDVMHELNQHKPDLHFIVPMLNDKLKQLFLSQINRKKGLNNITLIDNDSYSAIVASDLALVKSGTSTLETMFLKKPMVVAFKWSPLNHAIIAPQVKVPFISLPNLLANQALVPEFIQSNAKPIPIAREILNMLNSQNMENLISQFHGLHKSLKQNAHEKAALAICELISGSAH